MPYRVPKCCLNRFGDGNVLHAVLAIIFASTTLLIQPARSQPAPNPTKPAAPNSAPNPTPGLEFPVFMRQKVVAGTTPVGTKVEAKLAVATLVNGTVVPQDALFSGEVTESVAK